jgi:hypothetical protein
MIIFPNAKGESEARDGYTVKLLNQKFITVSESYNSVDPYKGRKPTSSGHF